MTEKQRKQLQKLATSIENLIIGQARRISGPIIWGEMKFPFGLNLKHFHVLGELGGLARILDLIEKCLKDGSLFFDHSGKEECRTFVLDEKRGASLNLFGSSSIEGWLQLHLSSQVIHLTRASITIIY